MKIQTPTSLLVLALLMLSLPSVAAAQGTTIMVPTMEPTIQDGIDAAANGDEVVVAPGTYTENLLLANKSILLRSSSGAGSTVIDGSGGMTVLVINDADGSEVRGFTLTGGANVDGGGINLTASTDVTIRDCAITDNEAFGVFGSGGGIWVTSSNRITITSSTITGNNAIFGGGVASELSSFVVEDSEIAANNAVLDGGGIYIEGLFPGGLVPRITTTSIHDNAAFDGGGIAADTAFPSIAASQIFANSAVQNGGGLHAVDGGFTAVTESVLRDNTAENGGGAYIEAQDLQVLFRSTMITDNVADSLGGGVYLRDVNNGRGALTGQFQNCTFSNNSATTGGAAYVLDSRVQAINSIFWTNTATSAGNELALRVISFSDTAVEVDFSNLAPSLANVSVTGTASLVFGFGNIMADPIFVAPGTGNYQLNTGSPCIEAGGASTSPSIGPFDFENDTRVIDSDADGTATIEMGADEVCAWLKGDTNDDGAVNIVDMVFVLNYLFQGGPAPTPLARADVNGDGGVDLTDAVFIGNYLFRNGPPPVCRP